MRSEREYDARDVTASSLSVLSGGDARLLSVMDECGSSHEFLKTMKPDSHPSSTLERQENITRRRKKLACAQIFSIKFKASMRNCLQNSSGRNYNLTSKFKRLTNTRYNQKTCGGRGNKDKHWDLVNFGPQQQQVAEQYSLWVVWVGL